MNSQIRETPTLSAMLKGDTMIKCLKGSELQMDQELLLDRHISVEEQDVWYVASRDGKQLVAVGARMSKPAHLWPSFVRNIGDDEQQDLRNLMWSLLGTYVQVRGLSD